ncbi:MAG: SelB C-terminal domain-containing protein, partial [Lachnospiraceae bacterium]|nr:SelB C-terminal domain-containing protein [Lachnospiraceae bacterium]
LSDTYGPDDKRPKVLNLIKKAALSGEHIALSDGGQDYDAVHIDDAVRAFCMAGHRVLTLPQGSETYQVVAEQPLSLRETVETMLRVNALTLDAGWGERPSQEREIRRAIRLYPTLPGWRPEIPLEQGLSQLLLEEPLAVRKGDRFVVRFYSPVETIGGGVVLEPNPKKKKRFNEDALDELRRKESGSLADICELHIREHGETMITRAELAKIMSHSQEELQPYLDELVTQGLIYAFEMKKDVFYWHKESEFLVRQDLSRDMKRYHEKYPFRHGMKTAEVHVSYMKKVKMNVFDAYVRFAEEHGYFKTYNEFLSLPDHEIDKNDAYRKIESLLTDAMEQAGYELLRFSEIDLQKTPEAEAIDVMQLLMEEGRVVRINEEMFTMAHFMEDARKKIEQHFESENLITIAQVRDMFATNRKSAKPILEYMDELHVTKKVGAETERVPYA